MVRLSGPDAGRALSRLAGRLPPPRSARRRRLADPQSGEPLDEALVLWFPGPQSFTGEDVAELHLHGSRAVLAAVMEALRREGLRFAEPGEFTRRAFLNGKLDLTQAEAVADLAAAETEAQRRQALRQLDGALGGVYCGWAQRLLRALAHLEAAIDFPDEDLPAAIEDEIAGEVEALAGEIVAHLADGRRGERLRDGIMVAILGPPNAGKSSLLNRIARREAAITSPYAGTTRDIVEVAIDLAGWPVVLADTAGLREADDAVEREGLRRALARAEEAEIRLFVYDVRHPAEAAGAARWPGPDTLLIANKIDLLPASPLRPTGGRGRGRSPSDGRVRWVPATSEASPTSPRPSPPLAAERVKDGCNAPPAANLPTLADEREEGPGPCLHSPGDRPETVMPGLDPGIHAFPDKPVDGRDEPGHDESPEDGTAAPFPVSALTGAGLDALLAALAARVAESYRSEAPVLTRARHRAALEDAAASLARALAADLPELRAEDLRLALRALGRITGAVDVEDLLDVIFRDFCLGK